MCEVVVAKTQCHNLENSNMPTFFFNIEEFYQYGNFGFIWRVLLMSSLYVAHIKIFVRTLQIF